MFGVKTGFAVTQNHELHRMRRAPFAHYFSKSSLQKLEPGVQSIVDNLTSRLDGLKGTGKPVDLKILFSCMTADVIGRKLLRSFSFLVRNLTIPYDGCRDKSGYSKVYVKSRHYANFL